MMNVGGYHEYTGGVQYTGGHHDVNHPVTVIYISTQLL